MKHRRSFGSNSDGKERGLALCELVSGCCDNGLKGGNCAEKREKKKKKIEFMFYEIVGGCGIFLGQNSLFFHLVRCQIFKPLD